MACSEPSSNMLLHASAFPLWRSCLQISAAHLQTVFATAATFRSELGLCSWTILGIESRATLNWILPRGLHLMACGRRCPVTGNVSRLFEHALGDVCLSAVEALLAHSSWAPSNRCFLSLLDICCNAPASMSDDGAMVALQAWFCSSLCGLPSPMSQAMYEY